MKQTSTQLALELERQQLKQQEETEYQMQTFGNLRAHLNEMYHDDDSLPF